MWTLLTVLALATNPVLFPEHPISEPTDSPAGSIPENAAVAAGAGIYLVAWADSRDASRSNDLYAARVDGAGHVLDRYGIPLSVGTWHVDNPSVAFDGTNFLVVWQDARNGGWDLYGARVSPTGSVLDPNGFVVRRVSGWSTDASVAFGGGTYLVAFKDSANSSDVRGALVAPNATVGASFVISGGRYSEAAPSTAFDGTQFVVAWEDKRNTNADVYAARVTTSGSVLDPSGIAVSTGTGDQVAPKVAFDGTEAVVAFADKRSGSYKPTAARLSLAGVVLDASGIAIPAATGTYGSRVAFDGTGAFFTWTESAGTSKANLKGARLRSGAIVDATPLVLHPAGGKAANPAMACAGGTCFAAWEDWHSWEWDLFGARIDPTMGTALDAGFLVAMSGGPDSAPALAFDGVNYLAVWQSRRAVDTGPSVFARRVDPDGLPLDAVPLAIPTLGSPSPVSVAFDGVNWVLAWADTTSSDIYALRVSLSGTLVDTAPIPVAKAPGNQFWPGIAGSGSGSLIAWADTRAGTTTDIYAARLSTAGIVLDPTGIALTTVTPAIARDPPKVDFDGTDFVVAWSEGVNGYIRAARVSTAGAVRDVNGFLVAQNWNARYASVGCTVGTCLVAWLDSRVSLPADVYASAIAGGATVGTAVALNTVTGKSKSDIAVTWDGRAFFVGWTEERSYSGGDVYGRRVTTAGIPLGTSDFPIAAEAVSERQPALASAGADWLVAAYVKFDPSTAYGDMRVHARAISTLAPNGTACAAGAECVSGFCVDGVCCGSECGGGLGSDCLACATAKGAAVDGTCGPVRSGFVCRAAASACDAVEACDGNGSACPADGPAANGTPCAGGSCAAGVCVAAVDAGTEAAPDASAAGPDASAAGPDASAAGPDASAAGPDASAAGPDASAGEDASSIVADAGADASESAPDGAIRPDAGTTEVQGDAGAEVADASGAYQNADAAGPAASAESTGCGCSSAGAPLPISVAAFALLALRRRKPVR